MDAMLKNALAITLAVGYNVEIAAKALDVTPAKNAVTNAFALSFQVLN